jgi:tetratricopeptide (TPR) repeat protein
MGFFVRDLHKDIAALHAEQYGGQNHSDSLVVYRGQGLSQTDFNQLQKTQGGLLSFNNFLSTSQKRDVAQEFTRRTINTSNLVGVLFVMKIDLSLSGTPFANVQSVGFYRGEEKEILFSMHSVFRIGQVKQINESNRLWQVDLTLTSDNDPQLHSLTTYMRKEIQGSTGWHRLGQLMIQIAQFDKAEELYEILLKQTSDEREKGSLFHQLGFIKSGQGKYTEAIEFYKKALEIERETLPSDHPDLATFYNNIGLVYYKMDEYTKTLLYYKKALEIRLKNLPPNHISLATTYNNIGLVCGKMDKHSEALLCYEKALQIKQKTLPPNHPALATAYNNIGSVYRLVGEYSKALLFFEKDLEISQKTLTPNHPDLGASYNNIAYVYREMGEYSKALSHYQRALDILQRSLPSDHPNLQSIRTCIESVKKKL